MTDRGRIRERDWEVYAAVAPSATGRFGPAERVSPDGRWTNVLLHDDRDASSPLLVLSHRIRGPLVLVTVVLCVGTGIAPFTEALGGSGGLPALVDLARAVVVAACVPVFAALFPDGRWNPRWVRRWWPVLAGAEVAQFVGPAVVGPAFDDATLQPLPALLLLAFYVGIQVHRFRRRSDWAARQQA